MGTLPQSLQHGVKALQSMVPDGNFSLCVLLLPMSFFRFEGSGLTTGKLSMPIPVQCNCGRSFRAKDELAGRKARCPNCSTVLTIPQPEPPPETEDEVSQALLDDSTEDAPPARPRTKPASFRAEETDRSPAPPPRRAIPQVPETKPAKRPKRRRSSRDDSERSRGGVAINPAIVTGLLMMAGAAIWFFVGLAANIIFFYPPVLFLLGIGSVIRGFTGGD